MSRGLLRAVAPLFLLLLLACGPSESEPAAKPGGGGGMQAKPMQKQAEPPDPEAAQQQLLSLVVWDSSEPERDAEADAKVCTARASKGPDAKRGTHPLVAIQSWIECMKEFGWSQKKKS